MNFLCICMTAVVNVSKFLTLFFITGKTRYTLWEKNGLTFLIKCTVQSAKWERWINRSKHLWNGNIKNYLTEIEGEFVEYIQLEMVKLSGFMNRFLDQANSCKILEWEFNIRVKFTTFYGPHDSLADSLVIHCTLFWFQILQGTYGRRLLLRHAVWWKITDVSGVLSGWSP